MIDKKSLINKIGNIEDKETINKINQVITEHFGLLGFASYTIFLTKN